MDLKILRKWQNFAKLQTATSRYILISFSTFMDKSYKNHFWCNWRCPTSYLICIHIWFFLCKFFAHQIVQKHLGSHNLQRHHNKRKCLQYWSLVSHYSINFLSLSLFVHLFLLFVTSYSCGVSFLFYTQSDISLSLSLKWLYHYHLSLCGDCKCLCCWDISAYL